MLNKAAEACNTLIISANLNFRRPPTRLTIQMKICAPPVSHRVSTL
jgi:hypothetical protein